ncbi:GNAT family N-acetyltransferase [Meridianimarinicoccus roseus]|nr:N-acetyltransferase [Meridianimarinicoccus roseus]
MLKIRLLSDADETDLSVLLVSTFGQANELMLVRALRQAQRTALELVAVGEDGLVGYICLSRLDAPEGWLALAPVCVRNEDQRKGIGSQLVTYALDQARQRHFAAVVVVGDKNFYSRHGFVFQGPAQLTSPYPSEFTGLFPIRPDTAKAQLTLVYPEPFDTV